MVRHRLRRTRMPQIFPSVQSTFTEDDDDKLHRSRKRERFLLRQTFIGFVFLFTWQSMPKSGQTVTRKDPPQISLSIESFQRLVAVEMPVGRISYEHPEFGGVEVNKVLERQIHVRDGDRYDRDREKLLQSIDFKLPGDHKLRQSEQPCNNSKPCQVLSWTESIHPTCNLQHETSPSIETADYISSGSFRDSWLLTDPSDIVMKTFVFEEGRPFGPLIMRFIEVSGVEIYGSYLF